MNGYWLIMSGNNKPTILFLNHWARRLGGAEHSLGDILAFVHDKCNCHLATTEPGPLTEMAEQYAIPCHIIPCSPSIENINRNNLLKTMLFCGWRIAAFLFYVYRLKKLLTHLKPDLIHTNVPKSHFALFMLRILGYQGACCFHLREIFRRNSTVLFLYRMLFPRRNSSVIAISRAVKSSLPFSMRQRATVIYNGVSCCSTPKEHKIHPTLKLLYLGRVVPWKGCHHLIDILAMLIEKFSSGSFELSLVGDTLYWSDKYRDVLTKKINDLSCSSCCQVLPATKNPESVFLSHDIFCNASENEPFGRVIAEAQGCGLPVVAYNTGGIPEIVTHNETGFLVGANDKEAFVESLGGFYTKPQLMKQMGTKGWERMCRYFNRDRQIPQIYSFLCEQTESQQKL